MVDLHGPVRLFSSHCGNVKFDTQGPQSWKTEAVISRVCKPCLSFWEGSPPRTPSLMFTGLFLFKDAFSHWDSRVAITDLSRAHRLHSGSTGLVGVVRLWCFILGEQETSASWWEPCVITRHYVRHFNTIYSSQLHSPHRIPMQNSH